MSVGDKGVNINPSQVQPDVRVREQRPETREEVRPVEVKGSYKGQEVEVQEDSHALVADAAEEITFSASETVEKKLFDRKVDKRENKVVLSPEETQKAENNAKKLKGMDPEKLKSFLAHIRQNRPSSSDDLLKEAKREFSDPTERHVALEFLRDVLSDSGEDPELLTFVDTAIIKFEAEEGPAIQAGYNINNVPTTELGDVGQHRETYRENVLSFRNASEMFTNLMSTYGEGGVGKMLDYMSDSLAADLSSITPSSDPERLNIAGDGIVTARNILNVMDEAGDLLNSMSRDFGGKYKDTKPGDLVQLLFGVKDGQLTNTVDIKRRLPLKGRADPTHDVEFMKGMLNLARSIPDRLFSDPSMRQMSVDVLQKALDEAVELEERVLDGLE